MKKTSIILSVLAVTMALFAVINSAMAYFTTYTATLGRAAIVAGETRTEFEEPRVSQWTKHLVIENTGSADCFVRARAYAGSEFTLVYSSDDENWYDGEDGYWYYSQPVPAGASTSELLVHIDDVPEDSVPGDNFNVVVIYECSPALYDENGNPYADWTQIIEPEGGR